MTNNSAAVNPQTQKFDEAIGGLSRAWGHVELAMTAIMGELMETPPETAMIVSAALDFRHRRDLITSLAAIKLKGNAIAEQLADFISRVRGMNKERNGAIHALWIVNPGTHRMEHLTMRNQGSYEMKFRRVGAGHLRTIAGKMNALSNEGVSMISGVREAVHAWREQAPQLEWPPLEAGVEHDPASRVEP